MEDNVSLMIRIDADRRVRIPEEWGDEFAPEQQVELVRCDEGLLVKPLRRTPLAEVLRQKVNMGRPTHVDLSDLNMDELGW
jgi:hypothetical protein